MKMGWLFSIFWMLFDSNDVLVLNILTMVTDVGFMEIFADLLAIVGEHFNSLKIIELLD